MGYPSYREDIREEVESHFDPMGRDEQAASSNELPIRKGERVKLKADKKISESEDGIRRLRNSIYTRGAIGIVNYVNKSETGRIICKVTFCIEDKTVTMELPLSLLEKVS